MRRTGFVLALPLVLPFVAGVPAWAEDPAPPAPPAAPTVPPAPAVPMTPAAPKQDAAKPSTAPKADPGPASLIPFLTDYDAAKKQAAEQKKGLFVYLTPDWFT